MLCVVGSSFLASIRTQRLQTVAQYSSVRFSWSVAESFRFMMYSLVTSIVALSVLAPVVKTFLAKRMSSVGRDRILTKASAWGLAIGTLFMSLATTPGIFLCGIGMLAVGSEYYTSILDLGAALAPASWV
jgi:hypothetical protein